jgi:integrase
MATITKVARQSGHAYRVQIRIHGKKPISKTFRTKKLAQAFARDVEGNFEERAAGLDSRLRKHTLAELIDKFMMNWAGKDQSTIPRLVWWSEQYGKLPLEQVDRETIQEALERLATEPWGREGRQRSPATINRYHTALSSAFQNGIQSGWYGLTVNPCRGIRKHPEKHQFDRFLSEEERKALLQSCRESRSKLLYPLVLLALTTGARKGELLGLRWQDIDLDRKTARLYDTKSGKPRILPLVDAARVELKTLRERSRKGASLVFPNLAGNAPVQIDPSWKAALHRAGVESFRFHDLRHTAASYLTMAGIPLVTVAEILGHQTLSMVQRYAHHDTAHKASVVNKVLGDL